MNFSLMEIQYSNRMDDAENARNVFVFIQQKTLNIQGVLEEKVSETQDF